VSLDTTDGLDGTWYGLPWASYTTGSYVSNDIGAWEAQTEWPADAWPSENFFEPYGEGGLYDSFITGSAAGGDILAESWQHFWTYSPALVGENHFWLRFTYMTDWSTQMKGMWIDEFALQDAGSNNLWYDPMDATSDWIQYGNFLADGTPIFRAGWVHPPAAATPQNFMVACIVTNMDTSFATEGSHQIFYMPTDDDSEVAIVQRLAEERLGTTEMLTLLVFPTTDSDAPSDFVAGTYCTNFTDTSGTVGAVDFTMAPPNGAIEGAVMFQWDIGAINPETVFSIMIEDVTTGDIFVEYAAGTNVYVWRTEEWANGNYVVNLRATYLNFSNAGILSPYYLGQSTYTISADHTYSLLNAAPVVDMAGATLEVLSNVSEPGLTQLQLRFTITITDASELAYARLYHGTTAITLSDPEGDNTYTKTFNIVANETFTCKVQTEDVYGYRTVSAERTFPTGWTLITTTTTTPPTTTTTTTTTTEDEDGAPGFEAIFALFALAGVAVLFSRRRE
jgi:PGF-CTERM protein